MKRRLIIIAAVLCTCIIVAASFEIIRDSIYIYAFRSGDTYTKTWAAVRLGRSGSERARAALGEGLNDSSIAVREAAVANLLRSGDAGTLVSYGVKAVDHPDPAVRAFAVLLIAKYGATKDENVSRIVVEKLEDDNTTVQLAALTAVCARPLAPDVALGKLCVVAGDSDRVVREQVVRVVGERYANTKDGREIILRALADCERLVRMAAVRSMMNVSQDGKAGIPALRKMLSEEDEAMKEIIQSVIRILDTEEGGRAESTHG
jgi:HEAT repeat protein